MGGYLCSSPGQRAEMLRLLGCEGPEDLYRDIPGKLLLRQVGLPPGQSEQETERQIRGLAAENRVYGVILRGAGAYDRYIPAVVDEVASKEGFLTSYTPYQAEISQGVLQAIFEYQTMICELTGMDAANASVYDGACAAAEGAMMCRRKGRDGVAVSETAGPQILETLGTYCRGRGVPLTVIPEKDGRTDAAELERAVGDGCACAVCASPNRYGLIEDSARHAGIVHAAGAKFVLSCDPISLAVYASPAECGADVAVGEGQPLGIPLSFGGPYLGFMACTAELMRKLPGRMAGMTEDSEGRRAFVLTLQAREQHIRREKAGSNICSNEALCALRAAVYMSAMGLEGMRSAAELSHSGAEYLAEGLGKIGYPRVHDGEFFDEFATECPIPAAKALSALAGRGILGGLELPGNRLLWCVTETACRRDLDLCLDVLREAAL